MFLSIIMLFATILLDFARGYKLSFEKSIHEHLLNDL